MEVGMECFGKKQARQYHQQLGNRCTAIFFMLSTTSETPTTSGIKTMSEPDYTCGSGREMVVGVAGSFDNCPHFDGIDVSDFDSLQKRMQARNE